MKAMHTENETGKKKGLRVVGLIVVILLVVVAAYFLAVAGYFLFDEDDESGAMVAADITPAPLPAVVLPSVPAPLPAPPETPSPLPLPVPEPPAVLYPIEPEVPDEPLPELGESDTPVHEALGDVMGKKGLSLMMSEELIYHIVVTVDNLPRKHLPTSIVPLKRAGGVFVAEGEGETLAIGAQNARRYAAYMAAIRATDSARLVALYRHFYPLFQSAYQELGYPQANFNDRLVTAIDDLLAAPDPTPPIRLTQPKVLYEYADPTLEQRSAGQKIMIRIGQENATAIREKLSEIRAQIAH
jgi:hypothetical protein